MLWMGWFGFNAGSSLSASTASAIVVANTQLASAACALVWVGMAWLRTRPNVVDALNGAIAGLVSETGLRRFLRRLVPTVLIVCLV